MAAPSTHALQHILRIRAENNNARILSVPLEVCRMIVDACFDNLLHINRLQLNFSGAGWVPPPILQVCHELHKDGLFKYANVTAYRIISDHDGTSFIAFEMWKEMIEKYYGGILDFGIEIDLRKPRHYDIATKNLGHWLKVWFTTQREA